MRPESKQFDSEENSKSSVVPSVMQQVTAQQNYFEANKSAQYSEENINGPESPVPLSEYYKELDFKVATSNSYINRMKSKVRR
jgi:hypothetical protein